MSEIMQFLEATFKPLVLVFTVLNLATMGLQARMPEVVAVFKNKKVLALIFVWGWVLGPVLGLLIAWLLPLAEPYVICVLIASLASCGPFLPPMVEKARGDVNFAGAFIPLMAAGTVVFMPLIAPLLIKGVTISAGALAKPLFVTLLVPLVIGAATRHYAETVATKIFPAVRGSSQAQHIADCRVGLRALWPCDARHGGQLCPPLCDNLHGRKGTDNVSIRFRPETESAQRHVAGYAHAQWCSDVRRHPCHSGTRTRGSLQWPSCGLVWSIALAAIAARIFAKQAGKTVAENTA